MKKSSNVLLILIVCLTLLGLFTFIFIKNIEKKKNNNKEVIIPQEKLFNQLSIWSMDIYQNKKYDKCVETENSSCFISLDSLRDDYGKDISMFKQAGAECISSISGLSFDLDNENEPFSIILGGCKYNNPAKEE